MSHTWHTWNGTQGRLTIATDKASIEYVVKKIDTGYVIKHDDDTYIITERKHRLECSCPAWNYSKSPQTCKHVKAIGEIPVSRFQKAVKKQLKLRLALCGPTGSGKTYTALSLATNLGKRVAVIDTEHGSASKYADLFGFDVLELTSFSPLEYAAAIREAVEFGYDVIVIDSLSHAWVGKDGALEQVDNVAKRSRSGNKFNAWGEVTPMQNEMIETMLACKAHLVVTMRSKMEYVQEKDDKGKTSIRKVGLAPVQRDGVEYEFDVVGDMDQENNLIVSKSRCPKLSNQVIRKPGKGLAKTLAEWLDGGEVEVEQEPKPAKANPSKPEPAKSTLPQNGKELQKRLYDYDAKLAKEGLCKQGDLVKHVIDAGVRANYDADISHWSGAALMLAAEETKSFESHCRQAKVKHSKDFEDLIGSLEIAGADDDPIRANELMACEQAKSLSASEKKEFWDRVRAVGKKLGWVWVNNSYQHKAKQGAA